MSAELRQEKSRPILEQLQAYAYLKEPRVLLKGPLTEAMSGRPRAS